MVGTAAVAIAMATGGVVGANAAPPKQSPPKCGKQQKKCPTVKQGRMTGQGTIDSSYGRSHHVFRNSICNRDKFPDLMVWWPGNRFKLTSYSSPLTCVDTPADEGNPRAGFDTIVGQGEGTLNGESGATASFRFTDAGEPGRNDTATITIVNADGDVVFQLNNARIAAGGNHQAHRK
jgi:hypothetical protein